MPRAIPQRVHLSYCRWHNWAPEPQGPCGDFSTEACTSKSHPTLSPPLNSYPMTPLILVFNLQTLFVISDTWYYNIILGSLCRISTKYHQLGGFIHRNVLASHSLGIWKSVIQVWAGLVLAKSCLGKSSPRHLSSVPTGCQQPLQSLSSNWSLQSLYFCASIQSSPFSQDTCDTGVMFSSQLVTSAIILLPNKVTFLSSSAENIITGVWENKHLSLGHLGDPWISTSFSWNGCSCCLSSLSPVAVWSRGARFEWLARGPRAPPLTLTSFKDLPGHRLCSSQTISIPG